MNVIMKMILQVTNQIIDEVISLPMHTELDDEQLSFITKTINDFITIKIKIKTDSVI